MNIPKNWSKVPLANFIHYTEYLNEEAESITDKIDLLKKKTCAILGCTVEEAGNLSGKESQELAKLLSKPLPNRLKMHFKHKGIRYRPFIKVEDQTQPHQVIELADSIKGVSINTLEDKFDFGKYTAFKNVAKNGHVKEGMNRNLNQLLYLVCEPVKYGFKKQFPFVGWYGYKPSIKEIERGVLDFKTLPMDVANPLCVFFLNLSKELSALLTDFSINELKKMTGEMAKLQASLEKDTDGLR